jgi:Tol biopolymer transport system component
MSAVGRLLLGAWVATAACAHPGFDHADLPEAPIAITYRTPAEAERVAELRRRAAQERVDGKLTVRLQQMGDMLGMGRSASERAADLVGRLALVDPRSQTVTIAEFSQRGSTPLSWSEGHERLLFLSHPPRGSQVFEVALGSGEVRMVTHGEEHLDASYGPGGRLAFSRVTGEPREKGGPGGVRIFVWEPGSGAAQPVTPGPRDLRPRWSPDGRILVYEGVGSDGLWTIFAMDPMEPGEPRALARGGRYPVFTPDGEWVVYTARTRDGPRIWRMRPDGSGKLPVGSSPYDEHDPAVSPDGRFVAFVSMQDDRARLVVRRLEGGGDRRIQLDGDAIRPTW